MLNESITAVKENISILGSQGGKTGVEMEILEVFNQNITANYYKLDVGFKEYEFLVVNERV